MMRRLWCRLRGHDWFFWVNWEDGPLVQGKCQWCGKRYNL